MKISEHFSLEDLIIISSNISNYPMQTELDNLKILVNNILEPLRQLYGKSIYINNGYLSPIVNRNNGELVTSQHVNGEAVDITGGSKEENEKLFNLISENFEFDQLINVNDFSCIHVSYSHIKCRNEKLKFDGKDYVIVL